MVVEWLVCIAVILLLELFRRRRNGFRYFEKLNIKGPPTNLLWGHYDVMRVRHLEALDDWCGKYGDNFGIFWGDKPWLVTKDLDLIQRVLVKEFHNFANRTKQFALDASHPSNSHSIFHQKGDRWKTLRGVITPAFTSSKMKAMIPLVQCSVNDLITRLEEDVGTPFDLYPILKRFTVDNIGRTAFGIQAKSFTQKELPTLLKAGLVVLENSNVGMLDLVANSFSLVGNGLSRVFRQMFKMDLIDHGSNDIFVECQKIVAMRRATEDKRPDLLQALLDANEATVGDSSLTATATEEMEEDKPSRAGKRVVVLRDEEVVSNVIIFFLAGYETTSSALAYLFHCLGKYQDVQDRLRAEFREVEQSDDENLYATLMKMKYLDQVIHETLRMYPPVTSFLTRTVQESTSHNGTPLPSGLGIYVPVYQLHHDPKVWPNPEVFDPERFSVENCRSRHPMAYMAFGDGPRNCVGMRFALMTIKLTVFKVLLKYRVVAEKDIKVLSKYIVSQPDEVRVTLSAV